MGEEECKQLRCEHARFGMSLTKLGDINKDGYNGENFVIIRICSPCDLLRCQKIAYFVHRWCMLLAPATVKSQYLAVVKMNLHKAVPFDRLDLSFH